MNTILARILERIKSPLVWEVFLVLAVGLVIVFALKIFLKGRDFEKSNPWVKGIWFLCAVLYVCVVVPATEEILFRLPLTLGFEQINPLSWGAVIVAALIFGFIHRNGNIVNKNPILVDANAADVSTGIRDSAQRSAVIQKISGVFFGMGLGVVAGFYAIQTQGIIVPFLIHAIWNAVAMVVIPAVEILVSILIGTVLMTAELFRK